MFNNKIAPKTSAVKKFCKVCHDAGKTETEYTSHFIRETRDPSSKVICPTLLSLLCRYCSRKGHTVKYCKFLEKDKIAEDRQMQSKVSNKPKSEEKYKQSNNMFSNLESDSENEEEQEEDVKEVEVRVPITTNINSYASALLRPAIVTQEVQPVLSTITKQNNYYDDKALISSNNVKNVYVRNNKSWYDTESDSDSEFEEEEEEKKVVFGDPDNW
jgi:hypothetical protein